MLSLTPMEVKIRCTEVQELPDRQFRATFASQDGVTVPRVEVFGRHVDQFEVGEPYRLEITEP